MPERASDQLTSDLTALAARGSSRHVVVQFRQPVGPTDRAALEAAGLQLLAYLGDDAFFAALGSRGINAASVAGKRLLIAAAPVQRNWKLHPDLIEGRIHEWAVVADKSVDEESETDRVVAVYVLFHADVSLTPEAVNTALRHRASIRSQLRTVNGLVLELPESEIPALADEDAVQYIEPPLPKFSEVNDDNRARVGANIVQAAPYGLTGAGVTVLVYDGGTGLASHQDFGGRLVARDTSGLSDHATHVAGTIGGSGAASGGLRKGMAPGVLLESYGFEQAGGLQQGFLYTDPGDLEADYTAAINVHGADISNNSIGTNTAPNGYPCEWEGNYGVTDTVIDSIVRGSLGAPFRVVWANGNERGNGRCGTTYVTTAPPACAKNHITVGALNSNDDSVTTFTSWGPADDGRIKPDISAPGCQGNGDLGVTSCSSSGATSYSVKCGTSMACPTVCGLGALILQDFRAQFPGQPDFRNSTLKTLLAHNAQDIQNVGPDYQTGYGSVRIQPTIDFLRSGNFIEHTVTHGATYSLLVVVNPGDPQLKVTLAWDDPAGTPNVSPALVNDLDLRVFDPSNTQRFPWTLNSASPATPAVRIQADHVNNIEQVFVANPAPGAWRVEVVGFNVPQGPQPFSLCASPILVNCSTQGVISLDRAKYACSSTAAIQVVDCDLNTDDGVVETVTVSIASDSEPAGESVLLTETSAETAAFRGVIPLAVADAPGTLLIAHGDTVTATYVDADNGIGGINVPVNGTALADCAAPIISNVQSINVAPRSATVTFLTDEPAGGTVQYGPSCDALTGSAADVGYIAAHSLDLTGLTDNTTYLYAVDAADEAGNTAADDNGGACYSFTTPEIPDYFTEHFAGSDNDLDNVSLLFAPSGTLEFYVGCATPIAVLPTDPAGGAPLTLSDDGSALVTLAGGAQVSIYGVSAPSFYVNANGNVTFAAADGDYTETLAEHFARRRAAAVWDDLNPSQGGTVSWRQLGDRAAVTWLNVPEHSVGNANTFQIELFFDGRITLNYLSVAATDALAGLSAGTGLPVDFFESDLSALGSCGPRPPAASSASIAAPTGLAVPITLFSSDDGLPDPPAELVTIVTTLPSQPLRDAGDNHMIAAGDLPYTLVNGGNQVIYQPAPGFVGVDSFQFKANDGGTPPDGGDSNLATISVNVQPVLSLPFSDNFPTTTFDSGKWAVVTGATIDALSISPPSAPNAARLNGDPSGADEVRTHLINLGGQAGARLTYSFELRGGGESPDAGDDLFVEFQDAGGAWQMLRQHLGSDADMSAFQAVEVLLPAEALHPAFRLRFRNIATAGAFDDWFVDNVLLDVAVEPVASNVSATLPPRGTVDLTFTAFDPNGDTLYYVIDSLPAHGILVDPALGVIGAVPHTLAEHGETVRFAAAPGYLGFDAFAFHATDGLNDSNAATANLSIGGAQVIHSFPLDAHPGWTTTGQWQFGQPAGQGSHGFDPTGGFTGTNVYGYNLAGDYPNNLSPTQYLTTTALDCSGVISTELRFRRWLGVESATYDHANIQISANGTTWFPVWNHLLSSAISDTSWVLRTHDISARADNQPTVYLRWGMGTTDSTITYPGWNIDDVEIWGVLPAGAPGDLDGDGDVDAADFLGFPDCMTGPDAGPADPGCHAYYFDLDYDVDMEDYAAFQQG